MSDSEGDAKENASQGAAEPELDGCEADQDPGPKPEKGVTFALDSSTMILSSLRAALIEQIISFHGNNFSIER